jgi:hypothetical protein
MQWLPCPLSRFFGGKIPQPPERTPCKAFSREELLIQLLAAEHLDEELDNGELVMITKKMNLYYFDVFPPLK